MDIDDSLEREKWLAELDLKKRELDIKEREQATRDAEHELRKKEHAASTWRSPLIVAILAAAVAAAGNAVVTVVNGNLQRDLETRKREAEIGLEKSKAESTRILEMIKTGDTEKAAGNLDFLLKSGLLTDPVLTAKLSEFLKSRSPGSGPSLPSPTGRVGFEQSDFLSHTLQERLQTLLDSYFGYLDKVGFPPAKNRVIVKVEDNQTATAYYVDNSIVIDRRLADDPSIPLREYNHHVLTVGKHRWRGNYAAIESGLADYFACSFLENPRLGEKSAKVFDAKKQFIRNLDNNKSYSDLQKATEYEYPYLGAEVWGGVFWKLREKLGRDIVDATLASAWLKFNLPSNDGEVARAFVQALLTEVESKASNTGSLGVAQAIFKDNDFPI